MKQAADDGAGCGIVIAHGLRSRRFEVANEDLVGRFEIRCAVQELSGTVGKMPDGRAEDALLDGGDVEGFQVFVQGGFIAETAYGRIKRFEGRR